MIRNCIRWIAALSSAITVIACGGDMMAGVSSGGTGFAAGAVTGFGSIIVDGKRWDVRDARIETQVDPAQPAVLAEVKLGQRVEIDFQISGTARTVRIEANVIGRVSAIADSGTGFTVAGQAVRVNENASEGPVTVFVGYDTVSEMRSDDVVEVHGAPRYDTAFGGYLIDATRVEKLASLPAGLIRVAGVAEGVANGIFRVGRLTVNTSSATVFAPAGSSPTNGGRVVVWGREPIGNGPSMAADFVRTRVTPTPSGAGEVSGAISRLDSAQLSFEVNGIRVAARDATVISSGPALASGVYVSVTGTFLADGSLKAAEIRVRDKPPGDAQVELKGVVTDLSSSGEITVRGVTVDAGTVPVNGCGNTLLATGQFLEVKGKIINNVVTAVSVDCTTTPPPDATLAFKGTAEKVDVDQRTFTLKPADASQRVATWSDTTLFVDVTPATLAGKSVEVEGYIRGNALVATKVKAISGLSSATAGRRK